MDALEAKPVVLVDDSLETLRGMNVDYPLDDNLTLRYHVGNSEHWLGLIQGGDKRKSLGQVARIGKFKEGDKSKDIMERRRMNELAKKLRPRNMLELVAIRQTVYDLSRAEEETSKKRRLEEGTATPGAATPGSRSRSRTPPLRGAPMTPNLPPIASVLPPATPLPQFPMVVPPGLATGLAAAQAAKPKAKPGP